MPAFTSGTFEKLLEKATSNQLLEPDWDSTLQICDCIRSGEVPTKQAAASLSKRLNDKNPTVVLFSLSVVESCVKNCGGPFHESLFTQQFMSDIHDVATRSDALRNKVGALVQAWDKAFKDVPKFRCIHDTYVAMKSAGFSFPTDMKESDYMFVSECAPSWSEDTKCFRCRTQFSMLTRQHHCRHCGESFCSKCSSKTSTISKFGIENEVRVCDSCFDLLNRDSIKSTTLNRRESNSNTSTTRPTAGGTSAEDALMKAYLESDLARENQVPQQLTSNDKQKEQEELELALALSQSEAEVAGSRSAAPKESSNRTSNTQTNNLPYPDLPKAAEGSNFSYTPVAKDYVKASEVHQTPISSTTNQFGMDPPPLAQVENQPIYQNGHREEQQIITRQIEHQLEIFLNRMTSNMTRGRSIAQDSSVQSLYQTLASLHPQLAKLITDNENRRAYYEGLQDQLSQMKDAREALDAMREDYQEKLRIERAEKERQIELERQQKLDSLRNLKHQFLMRRMQQLELQRQTDIMNQQQVNQAASMQMYPGAQPQVANYYQGYPGQAGYMPGQGPAAVGYAQAGHGSLPGPGGAIPPQQQMPMGMQPQPFDMQNVQQSLPPVGYPPNQQPPHLQYYAPGQPNAPSNQTAMYPGYSDDSNQGVLSPPVAHQPAPVNQVPAQVAGAPSHTGMYNNQGYPDQGQSYQYYNQGMNDQVAPPLQQPQVAEEPLINLMN